MHIGVAMVTFRGGETVTRALSALARAAAELERGTTLETVVVDNNSADGTVERVRECAPWAKIVQLPRNLGFAAGCNIGIAHLRDADPIVLLNPDVEVRGDFLLRLARLDWPPNVAARGPAVFDGHGALEQSARGFPRARTGLLGRSSWLARVRPHSRLLARELLADADSAPRAVDWVSGACLIAPAERFRSIGLLDEAYFMYWEDADWCRRAREKGYLTIYDPSLVVTHHQGSSSRQRPASSTIAFHRSAYRYWRLHVAKSRVSRAGGALLLAARCVLKLGLLAICSVSSRLQGNKRRQ